MKILNAILLPLLFTTELQLDEISVGKNLFRFQATNN